LSMYVLGKTAIARYLHLGIEHILIEKGQWQFLKK
jgi:hypothetical protein